MIRIRCVAVNGFLSTIRAVARSTLIAEHAIGTSFFAVWKTFIKIIGNSESGGKQALNVPLLFSLLLAKKFEEKLGVSGERPYLVVHDERTAVEL
jgi:hypothetical protein